VNDDIYQRGYVQSALKLLGIEKLVLSIHDQSFPSFPEEETGRGTPYSYGGERFVKLISELGFTGIQLGPQGKTSLGNPSPYDGTLFSKNELSISLSRLADDKRWSGLIEKSHLDAMLAAGSSVSGSLASAPPVEERNYRSYRQAWHLQHDALQAAWQKFSANRSSRFGSLAAECQQWQEGNESWLVHDQQYEEDEEYFRFTQFLAHAQHQDFRRHANAIGIKLFGDLQIGFSVQDVKSFQHLLLPNYLIGAPPSRTNPDGQPWGYPVLNPRLYFTADGALGPALQWMVTRIDKFLVDYDGIRIDHPHGLVCPWVYKSMLPDALRAVQHGTRLFDSPAVAEHPELAQFAIVTDAQINEEVRRYSDNRVQDLTGEQIGRYAVLIDLVLQRMAAFGFDRSQMICEVLSSCPYPLQMVLKKNNLGRLRVTQKAHPTNISDNYRSDTAKAEDWIMAGTHDTEPLWLAIEKWSPDKRATWSQYLAQRLETDVDARADFAVGLAAQETALIEAMFADLFVGPSKNVAVFFADLLGLKQVYNDPGIVNDANWMLSVPNGFESSYKKNIESHSCLYLPRALAMALRGKLGTSQCALNLADRLASKASLSSQHPSDAGAEL
jgi:4-alpha-glucanotransferase